MTTVRKAHEHTRGHPFGLSGAACLVTDSEDLKTALEKAFQRRGLPLFWVSTADALPDIAAKHACDVVIFDLKLSRTHEQQPPIWVLPYLRDKLWVFLADYLADMAVFPEWPSRFDIFKRDPRLVDSVPGLIQKLSDPESSKRMEMVHYVQSERTFLIVMGNQRVYSLKLDDLPQADKSPVKSRQLSEGQSYFRVVQESGNDFEVPWDVVLFHCEPEYEYHSAKQGAEDNEVDRATRIGRRVRELRLGHKLTVAALAKLAGIQRSNLSRLESGKHVPSLETLERIADALGVPVARLVARLEA